MIMNNLYLLASISKLYGQAHICIIHRSVYSQNRYTPLCDLLKSASCNLIGDAKNHQLSIDRNRGLRDLNCSLHSIAAYMKHLKSDGKHVSGVFKSNLKSNR